MRLVRFTLAGKEQREVYINPEHVVSVEPFKAHVEVTTTATRPFAVSHELDYILSMLRGPE